MPYKKAPADHSEFGGGPGMIDPMNRKDRTITPEEQLWEIYSTNPADPKSAPETSTVERP